MGLADFLAQVGQGKTLGHVGEAFGGQTINQQRVDEFVHKQLPALLQQIHGNTDETKVRDLGGQFLTAAMTAGMPAQNAEKLMEMTIAPALQGIRQEGLNNLAAQYRGQPEVLAESRPEINGVPKEGPLTPQGNFVDPKAATPDKPLDLNFMMKYAQLTGANPEVANKMLHTPVEIAGKEASNRKTLTEINKEQQAQRQREGLSNKPLGQGLPSLQDIGTLAPAGLPQTLPQREKPEDPLLEERRGLINAQIGAANAHAAAALRGPAGAGGSEVTTDRVVDPAKQADAGRQIAQAAKERGMTSPEQIRKIADDFGYTITGDPKIDDTLLSAFGVSNPKLGGTYSLTPKDITKTTTKGAQGNQGGYSKKPSGSAPVEPTAPKRMKFDAKGNLIQ